MTQQVSHGHIENKPAHSPVQTALRIEHISAHGKLYDASVAGVTESQAKQPRQEKPFKVRVMLLQSQFERLPGFTFKITFWIIHDCCNLAPGHKGSGVVGAAVDIDDLSGHVG
jgi:hypothetical protein